MTLSMYSILAFTMAMFLLVVTPGPAFFAVIARSMQSGRKAGIGVVVGVVLADLVFYFLAFLGMASLFANLSGLFEYVRVIAGLYLVYLGVKMWRTKPLEGVGLAQNEKMARSEEPFFKCIIEGLAVNLTNPKAILFFAALLPNFVDLSHATLLDSLVLGTVVVVVGGGVDLFYVSTANSLRKRATSERSQKMLSRLGGATLISIGGLMMARRP